MKSLLYSIVSLSCLLTACANQYSVRGTSADTILDGQMAYIKTLDNNVYKVLDSCEVLHGQFHMSGQLDSPLYVNIFMGENNFIPIVLEEGEVKIDIANSQIKIAGTPLNDKLYRFLTSRDSLAMLRAELPKRESQMYIDGYTQDEIIDELSAAEMEYGHAQDKLETQFIKDNYDNVLGTTWFIQLCNQAFNIFGHPTTTPQIDEIYFEAPESFKNNKDVKDYMRRCDEEGALKSEK
ncbi:MAG: DUF4369 domain-containing protein [Bacteroidaceae bacterium]|nr:DUF4369 domain-containing protein [Bacteroidaceae bacterium]MBQ1665600.1 DUF4369 domain-containing protein [Bacteroidaceae bacterium]MBQ2167273.1 DUF4369 domain-containing protein [Bacteroidaceae bacterium]MBQ2181442.1 DUF4369 domain-containing protein [Bacteroidaceae bacterium]MBQ2585877.1 DUF4369 domain-containing protein [Bacteroidaceae bacterium]